MPFSWTGPFVWETGPTKTGSFEEENILFFEGIGKIWSL